MKIPSKIRIGDVDWTVKIVPGFRKKRGYLGMCQRWKKLITIDGDQSQEEQEVTFLHEVLHSLVPMDLDVSEKAEERLIEAIDRSLYHLIESGTLSRSKHHRKKVLRRTGT